MSEPSAFMRTTAAAAVEGERTSLEVEERARAHRARKGVDAAKGRTNNRDGVDGKESGQNLHPGTGNELRVVGGARCARRRKRRGRQWWEDEWIWRRRRRSRRLHPMRGVLKISAAGHPYKLSHVALP